MNNRVILLDDDSAFLKVLSYYVEKAGFEPHTFVDPTKGLIEAQNNPAAIVITDIQMPGMTGIEVIKKLNSNKSDSIVIIISGLGSVDDAVEAMKLGAIDFIRKPIDQNHFLTILNKAKLLYDLSIENKRLKNIVHDRYSFGSMIGNSTPMQTLFTLAHRVSSSSTNIMINGETGTGKEVLAKALHLESKRKKGPFIAINCAAVPANLIESELFGHVKGAFTGAGFERKGLLSEAKGGTFFMDEIGDLPLELQPKLLRVIQEREYTQVGSNKSEKIDVRIIAATHANLNELVSAGSFREDLFYRLNVINLTIPPVRDRTLDILPLFLHFLSEACKLENRSLPTILPEAAKILEHYNWPGNVREIQNTAQRCAVLCGEHVDADSFPFGETNTNVSPYSNILSEKDFNLESHIDSIFIEALQKNNWNQTQTASFLGISRNTLTYRMKREAIQLAIQNEKI